MQKLAADQGLDGEFLLVNETCDECFDFIFNPQAKIL